MFVYERRARFHEVDPAGFVFFAHFFTWAHEAMERVFEPLPGGYEALITVRRVGLPAVRVESEFLAPLRYGDVARIELEFERVGGRSLVLHYAFRCGERRVAWVRHTVVTTALDRGESCEMPHDVRAIAESHRAPPPAT